MTRFDELRRDNPMLRFNLYAMEPYGPVTLEIITPDDLTFSFTAMTAAGALEKAFPTVPTATELPATPIDIFT